MRLMSQGAGGFSEAGKYGCATVEYAGMVSFSYLKRSGSALAAGASTISRSLASIKEGAGKFVDKTGHGLKSVNEAGKYGCATVEYAGMASFSYLRRGGNAVSANVLKVTRPVTSTISRPFVFVKDKAGKVLGRTIYDPEPLRKLEAKVLEIEKRLASIEQHGVVPGVKAVGPKKEIDTGRREVLQMIVRDNLLVREAG